MAIKHLFNYCSQTGQLSRADSQKPITCVSSNGYYVHTIHGRTEYVHRTVWRLHYGEIPSDKIIDHINRNKLDNRLTNLRLVSYRENALNAPVRKTSKSKITGVWKLSSGKWAAQVTFNRKTYHIGCFCTKQQAKKARDEFRQCNWRKQL